MQRGQLQRQKVEALYAMPQICKTLDCLFPRWMKLVLLAAATYNFIFGIWAIFFPHLWFQWSGMKVPRYPEIWQSVGMIVGVYGVGYFIAAYNPVRHWPIILVGFLGKLFGPIGFAKAVTTQALPLSSTWITVTNDLIWIIPFGIILWSIVRFKVGRPLGREEAFTIKEAAKNYRISSGETLAEASQKDTVTLVFLRHFGCTFTRQILRGLQEVKLQAEKHDARLILVHMLQHNDENDYLTGAETKNVATIADPNCELYRAFGLGKGTFWELFGLRVWLKGAVAIFQGCGAGLLAGDGLQMPGAFVFRDGEILASQPARSASDLPDLSRLFQNISTDSSQKA